MQMDWNSAHTHQPVSRLHVKVYANLMTAFNRIGKEMEIEAQTRQHPYYLEYVLSTDRGDVSLILSSPRELCVYVSAVAITENVQEVAERMKSVEAVQNAFCSVLRELGVANVYHFQLLSARTRNSSGKWVQDARCDRKRKVRRVLWGPSHLSFCVQHVNLPCPEPPPDPCPLPRKFTIQNILKTLERCEGHAHRFHRQDLSSLCRNTMHEKGSPV